MGQIFGNVSDPRARESGRGTLPSTVTGSVPSEALRPFTEDLPARTSLAEPLAAAPAVGETLRARKEDLERRLTVSNRMLALSEKRTADLTVDELMELWHNL